MNTASASASAWMVLLVLCTLVAGCAGGREKARLEAEARIRAEMAERDRRRAIEALSGNHQASQISLHFAPVYFDYDRHQLREDQKSVLVAHAQMLKLHPEIELLIEGHCDARGSDRYNLELGRKRAENAKKFLVQSGVTAERLQTRSYGRQRPASQGQDEKSRALNRRVEFVVVQKQALNQP